MIDKLELPSKEYTEMMDKILERFEKGELKFFNLEDVMKRNKISNQDL